MSDADNVGSIFVDLKIDDSQLPAAMQRAATKIKSEASRTIPPIPVKIKPQYVPPSSSERAFQLRGAGANHPYFARGNAQFDRLVDMSARGEPLDEKSRQARYKEEERIIRRGRELERREGLKVEREMLREAAQAARQKEQLRTAAEKRVTREATIAAAQQYRAHKEAADKARAEIDKTAKRWAAVKGYVFGGGSIVGKSLIADMTGGLKMAGSLLSGIGNAFLAPWKLLFGLIKSTIPFILVGAGAMATIGGLALRAAAQFERLRARVQGITGSTAMTAEILRQGNGIQRRVPMFSNSDAIEALAMGHSSGMRGKDYSEAIVNAAATMQTTLTAVSYMITSGRTYQLRRYGIQTGSEKGQQFVNFSDQSGQNQRFYARTMEEHRNNILRAINIKFAGAADAASKTFVGTWAGVKNLIGDALREFGEGLLPIGKAIGQTVSDMLNKWVSSGKAKELGRTVGEWLTKAAASLYAGGTVLYEAFGDIKDAFRKSPEAFKVAIIESLRRGALLLGSLLITAIKGTMDFWKLVGSLLGNALMTTFAKGYEELGIAGSGAAKRWRNEQMEKGLNNMMRAVPHVETVRDPVSGLRRITKKSWEDIESFFKNNPELEQLRTYMEEVRLPNGHITGGGRIRDTDYYYDPVAGKDRFTPFGILMQAQDSFWKSRNQTALGVEGKEGDSERYKIIKPFMERLESEVGFDGVADAMRGLADLPVQLGREVAIQVTDASADIATQIRNVIGPEKFANYKPLYDATFNAGMERINSFRPEIPIKDFQRLLMQALVPMGGLGLGIMGDVMGGGDVTSWLLNGGMKKETKGEEDETRPEVVHVGFQEMIKKVQEDLFQKKQLDYLKDIADNTSNLPEMMDGSAFAN